MSPKAKALGDEPAFPSTIIIVNDGVTKTEVLKPIGLTKRELFAALRMAGCTDFQIDHEDGLKMSVKRADALIEELAKEQP